MEELLQEDPSNVYQVGAMVYHDEEGKDMALRLPNDYREWADVCNAPRGVAIPHHPSDIQKIDYHNHPGKRRLTSNIHPLGEWPRAVQ